MNTLKEHFRLNGLPYTLLKPNDTVALYGIGGTYTDEILHWEVDIIYIRKDKYGEREHIAKNDDFGRDRSRCFMNEKSALEYYDKLTSDLSQGVTKVIAGVGENNEVIRVSNSIVNLSLILKMGLYPRRYSWRIGFANCNYYNSYDLCPGCRKQLPIRVMVSSVLISVPYNSILIP